MFDFNKKIIKRNADGNKLTTALLNVKR